MNIKEKQIFVNKKLMNYYKNEKLKKKEELKEQEKDMSVI